MYWWTKPKTNSWKCDQNNTHSLNPNNLHYHVRDTVLVLAAHEFG